MSQPGLDAVPLAKTRRRLIPSMFVLYIVSCLDRINVGFAALQMNEATGFSSAVFGFGAGIFFIGYFLYEVPSNLMLQRVGARLCIARIMISPPAVSRSSIPSGILGNFAHSSSRTSRIPGCPASQDLSSGSCRPEAFCASASSADSGHFGDSRPC